jgi:hypothetical protein
MFKGPVVRSTVEPLLRCYQTTPRRATRPHSRSHSRKCGFKPIVVPEKDFARAVWQDGVEIVPRMTKQHVYLLLTAIRSRTGEVVVEP